MPPNSRVIGSSRSSTPTPDRKRAENRRNLLGLDGTCSYPCSYLPPPTTPKPLIIISVAGDRNPTKFQVIYRKVDFARHFRVKVKLVGLRRPLPRRHRSTSFSCCGAVVLPGGWVCYFLNLRRRRIQRGISTGSARPVAATSPMAAACGLWRSPQAS